MPEATESDTTIFEGRRPSRAEARHQRKAEKTQAKTPKPLEALTQNQGDYITLLRSHQSVVATGPAGTGKTYIPARIFARALIDGRLDKIIVSRVTVSEPKHALGFLPGKADAKMLPWLIPVIEAIRAEVSASTFEQWKNEGRFEIVPFEHMRGRSFHDAGIILDEAQNASYKDLKLFLTRTGKNSQVVIAGDTDQIDVHDSGLPEIAAMVRTHDLPMESLAFTEDDVVRSPFARAWVKAFARHEQAGRPSNVVNLDVKAGRRHNADAVTKSAQG